MAKTITEFAESIAFLKEQTGKKYTYEYYLHFSKKLDKGYVDGNLFPRYKNDFDFIIPLAIYYGKESNWSDYRMDYFGFYNNSYEPCRITLYIPKTKRRWELIKFDMYLPGSKTEFRLFFTFKNRKNQEIRKVSPYSDFRDIDKVLMKIKEELEKE